MQISFDIILFFAISILIVIEGIYAIINGKPLSFSSSTPRSAEKYEPNSYKIANKVFGVFTTLAGLVFLVNQLGRVFGWFTTLLPMFIALCVFIVGVIIYFILLKKKTN